jgi:chloride channel protein, CIC family
MAVRRLPSDFSLRGFRRRLATLESVPQFAVLGVVSGIVTGLAILLFRTIIEIPLDLFLSGDFEDFESLSTASAIMLPLAGSVVLAVMWALIGDKHQRVGVVHVLERLAGHQGHMPWQNALTQFVGGIIALSTGHSGGREGPAIHLGAACSSLVGQQLSLPNNSIRVLAGCGAAAAISATFNTPVAGVIFSMEVIMMEYTMAGFIPVILAAVMAALINQTVYGDATAFSVPDVSMNSLFDVPFLILEGISIGILAALFVRTIETIHRRAPARTWLRMLIAGTVTGLIAIAVPQVLGQGYDTVNQSLLGEFAFITLITMCFFKLIASAITVALGVPVGVIGPTLFIGATAGGALGYIGALLFPDLASSPALYVMLGMGAMMGAALQAPLAALMAVMELTQNPNIVLPAMLVIVIANITASQAFGLKSLFATQMALLGLDFRQNPRSMALNRASVASVMSRSFDRVPQVVDRQRAQEICKEQSVWLLVDVKGVPAFILRARDLATHLENQADDSDVDLKEIPAVRRDVASVLLQATLAEVMDSLDSRDVDAVYVNRISAPLIDSVVGIVTRENIDSFYEG